MIVLVLTSVGIHPGQIEPASPIESTTLARDFHPGLSPPCVAEDPRSGKGSRSALILIAHVSSWSPVRLRHVRGGVGRS